MKKKSAFMIVLLVVVLACALILNACGSESSGGENGGETQTQNELYTRLNTMLANVGYPVTLTSKTTENGVVFNGNYTITKTGDTYSVSYSYEKLSTFGVSATGEITVPEDYKTTCTGNMKIRNGKIVEQNGAEANVAVESLNVSGITLSETALTNVQNTSGSFSADVSSLKTTTGLDVNARDAKITIQYTDAGIVKITLTYSTAAYQAEISYRFS